MRSFLLCKKLTLPELNCPAPCQVDNEKNSFSKTDTDATFMHMKEDHMRNGQLKPGYNIQAVVEGEYIVGIDVSSERSDVNTLIPFLEKLNSLELFVLKNIICDAGYP